MRKTIVIIGMVIGSYVGSAVPLLWGESMLSIASLIFGALGGLAGIYVAYKFSSGF